MLGHSKNQNQASFFNPLLKDFIDPNHPLYNLAEVFPWKLFEDEFAPLYSNTGNPSKPIRLMVGLLILKQLHNLGDETLVAAWIQNPYFQYFTGEAEFQWKPPCDPSDLVHFRNRIGKKGAEKILEVSVKIQNPQDLKASDIIIDTTVQEKNITYPTDAKLARKISGKCNKIAKEENIKQRQTYTRTIDNLKTQARFGQLPNQKKQSKKAVKSLKTIAGRLVRELRRKLDESQLKKHQKDLDLFERVLTQKRGDKNKIYSLHEADVVCISKGKSHKKYEFGSKVSLGIMPGSNIIVSVQNFDSNLHDSKTLEPTLKMGEKLTGKSFKNAIVDRGFRGKKWVDDTKVILPSAKEKTKSKAQTKRRKCRQRAAIEPVIGHMKKYFGLSRNYLKGKKGDEMNAILSAVAFNLKHWMNNFENRKKNISFSFFKNLILS